jgi:hypothetical protein
MLRDARRPWAPGVACLVALASCNAISGVGDLTFRGGTGGAAATTSGASSSTGAGEAGSGGDEGGAGVGGGAGSGKGGAGGATSSSSGPVVPRVWCNETAPVECAPGQVCCYHNSDPALDVCAAPAMCGASYIELACDSPADCPSPKICCATTDGTSVTGTACLPSCTAPNANVCDVDAECADGTCDPWPNSTFPYPNYGWCP